MSDEEKRKPGKRGRPRKPDHMLIRLDEGTFRLIDELTGDRMRRGATIRAWVQERAAVESRKRFVVQQRPRRETAA